MKATKGKRNKLARVLREAAGLSQLRLACLLHVDRSRISRHESGEFVDSELLLATARACGGVRLIDLLVRELESLRDKLFGEGPLRYT